MAKDDTGSDTTLAATQKAIWARLRRPLALTRAGIVAERMARAFWPFLTALMVILAALMFGAHETDIPLEVLWTVSCAAVLVLLGTFLTGLVRLHLPSRAEALDRLDQTLDGRPLTALGDTQAIGAADEASTAVWRAHVVRMAERASKARAPAPDL